MNRVARLTVSVLVLAGSLWSPPPLAAAPIIDVHMRRISGNDSGGGVLTGPGPQQALEAIAAFAKDAIEFRAFINRTAWTSSFDATGVLANIDRMVRWKAENAKACAWLVDLKRATPSEGLAWDDGCARSLRSLPAEVIPEIAASYTVAGILVAPDQLPRLFGGAVSADSAAGSLRQSGPLMILSPHDPHVPQRGRRRVGATLGIRPLNRRDGDHLPDNGSLLLELDYGYSLSDAFAVDATYPFILAAGDREGDADYSRGGSDLQLRGRWWLTQRWPAAPVHAGLALRLTLPTGSEERGTGFGATLLRAELNTSVETGGSPVPRLHAGVGIQRNLEADGRGHDVSEYVLGLISNLRSAKSSAAGTAADAESGRAVWLDLAASDYSVAETAVEARLGFGYLRGLSHDGLGGHDRQLSVSLELQRRLDTKGTYSTPFAAQLSCGLSF